MIHKTFGGDEQDPPLGMKPPDVPGNGIEQVSLAEPSRGMDKKRVEGQRRARGGVGNTHGGRMSQGIGFADDKGFEGARWVKGRAAVSLMAVEGGTLRDLRLYFRGRCRFGLPLDDLGGARW